MAAGNLFLFWPRDNVNLSSESWRQKRVLPPSRGIRSKAYEPDLQSAATHQRSQLSTAWKHPFDGRDVVGGEYDLCGGVSGEQHIYEKNKLMGYL